MQYKEVKALLVIPFKHNDGNMVQKPGIGHIN
jgi:hypothetical protein